MLLICGLISRVMRLENVFSEPPSFGLVLSYLSLSDGSTGMNGDGKIIDDYSFRLSPRTELSFLLGDISSFVGLP
jgi:hypothetical protein